MSQPPQGSLAPAPSHDGIVVLTAGGVLSNIIVNGLIDRLGPVTVIEEQPESKAGILRRRVKMLGWIASLGQLGFGVVQRAFWPNTKRIHSIWDYHRLDTAEPQGITKYSVASVNSRECQDLLRALNPKVVAVYGTRIIRRATLRAVTAPFINYHAGINPKYRGQHPGYWALANGDRENAGVTIHLVDEGVDTGSVLYQARVNFAPDDTIASYQHVQAAYALPLFARAIADGLEDRLQMRSVDLPSQQFFPPTLWGYIATGITRGVW
jgi:folate-dependent phosphoribosylglycinamide formyltransferase PurN